MTHGTAAINRSSQFGCHPFCEGAAEQSASAQASAAPPCMPLLLSSILQVVVPGADWYTVPMSYNTLMLVPVKGTCD